MDVESKAISAPARQARRVWPVSAEAPRPTRSFQMLQHRNLIERFFNKLKYFRAVATRYEKHAANCLTLVKFAAARIWRKAHNSVP
jgi:transposase